MSTAETSQDSPAPVEKSSGGGVTLSAGRGGIIGIKAGMTQVYNDKGQAIPVTVIDLQPNTITGVKTKEKDGYAAVQVGLLSKKAKRVNKAQGGHNKKQMGDEKKAFQHYQEFRLADKADPSSFGLGQVLSAAFLKEGDLIDVTSVSKGRGFQGVMKRHNFAGGAASHGASICHRMPGSIGNRADPGKVFKNKKMAGHMGNVKVTIQNLKVVRINSDEGYLLIQGSVPGPRSALVTIQKAVKAG